MNKVIKLTIPLFACLGLLTISGCDQDDVTTKKDMITGIVMETQPNKTYYLKNEVLEVEGATIAVQYSQWNIPHPSKSLWLIMSMLLQKKN